MSMRQIRKRIEKVENDEKVCSSKEFESLSMAEVIDSYNAFFQTYKVTAIFIKTVGQL